MNSELGNSPELPPQFSARELKQSLDESISHYQDVIGKDEEHVFDTNMKAVGLHRTFQDLLQAAKKEGFLIDRKRYATLIADSLELEAGKRRVWMSEERIFPYTEAERARYSREVDPLWGPDRPYHVPENHALFMQHRNRAIEMVRIAGRYRAAIEGQGDYSFNIPHLTWVY